MRRLILEEETAPAALWSRRLVILAIAISGFGIAFGRFGYTDLNSALAVLVFALFLALVSLVAALFAISQIWRDGVRGAKLTAFAMFLSFALLAYPAYLAVKSLQLPRMNDVSTDFETPPQYSSNPKTVLARGGFTPAAMVQSNRAVVANAYPKVQPLNLESETVEVFDATQKVMKNLGWKVLDDTAPTQTHPDGQIEAITRSLFLGVPYNISIRIRATGETTRVDARSSSRFGTHDYGKNAELIERFNAALQAEIDSR